MLGKKTFLLVCMLLAGAIANAQSPDEFNLNKVYDIAADGMILLDSDDARVTIVGSDRNDVHVVIHYKLETSGLSFGDREPFEMEVRQEGGNLIIQELPREGDRVIMGDTDEEYTIRIEAPHGVDLELEGDDERYKINGMDGRISIDADDSQINLTDCKGQWFALNLDDGKLTMDQGRGILKLDVDDGKAVIHHGKFHTINLDSDDGTFELHTSLASDGSYHFDLDDGELQLRVTGGGGTFIIHHDGSSITAGSAFKQLAKLEHKSKYQLQGGTATVNMQVDDTNITLARVE